MIKKSWFFLIFLLSLMSSIGSAKTVKAGFWKFQLQMLRANVPFIVELNYEKNKLVGSLHNGSEKIPLKNISPRQNMIRFPLGHYEISMELDVIDDRTLRGFLIRHNKNPLIKTPLTASHGIRDRFEKDASRAEIDLNGKWSLEMIDDNNIKSPAVATFSQKDKFFTGSILTSTGDYRYLEGQIRGHSFEAASFDGVYNYIFRGNVSNGQMKASLLSNSITHMSGKLNPKAHLPDAFAQTELSELKFILPDLKGQSVNLNHSKFLNKPVIVQIFGSWCPNCVDEMNYLIPWYHENAKRGVEIIALAFERSLSVDHARKQLLKVQKKFKVPYLILQAGSTAQDKPSDALPGLKNFISFPTTLFLNKNHQVVKVHAGFSGPSTGEFFESWKTEFNHIVDEILK